MSEDTSGKGIEIPPKSRRAFVITVGQVAVTAPAVTMLLSATSKSAMAQTISPYQASSLHILDDFTFGNTHEDVDAIAQQSNFNFLNGTLQQDDHI